MKISNKNFGHRNFLKTLNKELNAYAALDDYKNQRCIKIEHTRFEAIHESNRDTNGQSLMMELLTRVQEASFVRVSRNGKNDGSLYITIKAMLVTRGREHNEITDWVVKPPKGKPFTLKTGRDLDKSWVDQCHWNFGRMANDEFYTGIEPDYGSKDFKEFLDTKGYKLLETYTYNFSTKLFVSGVNKLKNGIEVAYGSFGTYCSHPGIIKITKARGVKQVMLASIGVEKPGYYSHHNRCSIRPEQVAAAKKLASKVRNMSKGA